MKLLHWVDSNGLLALTIILLFFIPLYPKIPLVSLTYTWVSIRWDDVLVAFTILCYVIEVFRKKATFKTPVSLAIGSYWLIGLLATTFGVWFIFPHYPQQFTNMPSIYIRNAGLYFLRHVEYMLLFFVAYSAITKKKQIAYIIGTLVVTVTLVIAYGLGQRFFPMHFPAFSTMNEEFAKGFVLYLNATDRLESTFAGHYDLAAYMVCMIPILGSLIFGVKKLWTKLLLLVLSLLSIFILLWTASRTSYAVYIIAVCVMLILQKQKKWILPVLIVSIGLLFSFQNVWYRYASTVKPVQVAIDSSGKLIGIVKTVNGHEVIDKTTISGSELPAGTLVVGSKKEVATVSSLPVETSKSGSQAAAITQNIQGNITIAQTQTLDISITTRLQAEWPNAIKAWLRDPLFGSGFSAVGLSTDGNYFRILAETGLLGLLTFSAIFYLYATYLWTGLSKVNSPLAKSLLVGIAAGIVGIALNAVLIDVFEASKIAYTLWMLMGVSFGIVQVYTNNSRK